MVHNYFDYLNGYHLGLVLKTYNKILKPFTGNEIF